MFELHFTFISLFYVIFFYYLFYYNLCQNFTNIVNNFLFMPRLRKTQTTDSIISYNTKQPCSIRWIKSHLVGKVSYYQKKENSKKSNFDHDKQTFKIEQDPCRCCRALWRKVELWHYGSRNWFSTTTTTDRGFIHYVAIITRILTVIVFTFCHSLCDIC